MKNYDRVKGNEHQKFLREEKKAPLIFSSYFRGVYYYCCNWRYSEPPVARSYEWNDTNFHKWINETMERKIPRNIYILIVPVVAYSGKFCAVHGRKITEAVRLHDKINNLDKMSYFIHDIHFPTRNLTTFDVTTVHFHHTLHSLYSIFEGWA